MGGSCWSDDHYRDRVATRKATSAPTFKHDNDVRTGKASGVHATLDVTGGKVRESRDSDAHPASRPIAVYLDVTGSMAEVPAMIQAKLPQLMGLLMRKGIEHPQIMVGAIGDATCDKYPVQIGQFESGIEIEDNITNLYLEGGGGGQNTESYELFVWFVANRTAIDCFEKRGEKGFLFIIGDERFYPHVNKDLVERHFGKAKMESHADTLEVIKQAQEKYEIFYVMPKLTHHYGEESILGPWRKALGQNVLMLDDPNSICELIASTVAAYEGHELDSIVKDLGSDPAAGAVSRALTPYASNLSANKATAMAIPSSGVDSGLASV